MNKDFLRILVVEDEPQWSGMIVDVLLNKLDDATNGAPRTLFVDGNAEFKKMQAVYIDEDYERVSEYTNATILATPNMESAEKIIREIPILHMVTMDMELVGSHSNIPEKQGMVLLESVINRHPDAACLVVSGRAGELDVAKNSVTRYGAIDAILKGSSLEDISEPLWATLFYAEAERLKNNKNILDARDQAARGLQLIEDMSKDTQATFKRRFDDFLRDLGDLTIDEMSGLLNANLTIEYARRLLASSTPWGLGIILLDGLTSYEENYGSYQRVETVKTVSMQLKSEVSQVIKDDTSQLGHLGDGKFVIIAGDSDSIKVINDHLESWFHKISPSFYSSLGQQPQDVLSLRFFLKDSSQGFAGIDELMKLENVDEPRDTTW